MSTADCRKVVLIVAFVLVDQVCFGGGTEWKIFTNKERGFSIRYPSNWHVYTKEEIRATATSTPGEPGPLPVFAVQAPDRGSFYIIVDRVDSPLEPAAEPERAKYLSELYLGFCGKDLSEAGCTKVSERNTELAGQPAVEYVWHYPRMHGIVLVNKHWCFSRGSRGFFLAATAAEEDFDGQDEKFFTPMAQSLRLLGVSSDVHVEPSNSHSVRPAGSPEEAKIAFRSERDGNWEIYIMNVDGSGVRRLTNDPAREDMPRWSPDGKQIVFRSERDGNQEIYIMNSDGSHQRRLTNHPAKDSNPCFSPEGSTILFASKRSGNWDLYTMKPDGSNQRKLVQKELLSGGALYSPEGKRIVFPSAKDGTFDVYIMDLRTEEISRLTADSALESGPIFSPSGKRILFTSTRPGNFEVYIMNDDGSGQKNLTNNPANDGAGGFLSETEIVFFSDRTGDCEIYRMDLKTGEVSRITNSPGYDGLADVWVPPSQLGTGQVPTEPGSEVSAQGHEGKSASEWVLLVLAVLGFLYIGSPLLRHVTRTIPIVGDVVALLYMLHPVNWRSKPSNS